MLMIAIGWLVHTDLLFKPEDIITKGITEKEDSYKWEKKGLFRRRKIKVEKENTEKYDTIICPICKREIRLRKYIRPGHYWDEYGGYTFIRYTGVERPDKWLLPVKTVGQRPVEFEMDGGEWKPQK